MSYPDQPSSGKRLTRAAGGPISGVSGGLAAYAGIDPTLVRVLVALAALFTFPLGPIAYVVLWAIIPKR
jgi:phage shock protein C